MVNYKLLGLLFLSYFMYACAAKNKVIGSNTKKIEIFSSQVEGRFNCQGYLTIDQKYIYINLFGPLNRNILKLFIENDSITTINLINNERILINSQGSYNLFLNFFKESLSSSEKLKMKCLFDIIFTKILNDNSDGQNLFNCKDYGSDNVSNITYSGKIGYYLIEINLNSGIINEKVKIKVSKESLKRIDTFKKEKFVNLNTKNYIVND